MMKNVLSSVRGQARAVVRQLCTNGSAPVTGSVRNYSGSLLLQTQKRFQIQSPAVVIRSLGGVRGAHDQRTKGDEELLGFLEEEIATEKKMQRSSTIPTTFEGFSVNLDKSNVTLSRKIGSEVITLTANVNHSVDAEYEEDQAAKQNKDQTADEMRSKPHFDVEIKRGSQTLNFNCSYLENPAVDSQEEFNDVFSIDEVSIYDGEGDDKDYVVAGDILDGYLYDLFMNMLEERGVNNEFVEKFSELCTDYEHKLYVDLLVHLQKFLNKN